MNIYEAGEFFRRNFRKVLDEAIHQPVGISRWGRLTTILIAKQDYDKLINLVQQYQLLHPEDFKESPFDPTLGEDDCN